MMHFKSEGNRKMTQKDCEQQQNNSHSVFSYSKATSKKQQQLISESVFSTAVVVSSFLRKTKKIVYETRLVPFSIYFINVFIYKQRGALQNRSRHKKGAQQKHTHS